MMERRRTSLEQRIVEVIIVLIGAGIIWISGSIVDLKTQMAGLADKYALRVEFNELRLVVRGIKEKIDQGMPPEAH